MSDDFTIRSLTDDVISTVEPDPADVGIAGVVDHGKVWIEGEADAL